MTTTINLPPEIQEQRFVLSHVCWETYESLLADYFDTRTPRFTYSEGVLEVISPTAEHEKLKWPRP